MHQPKWLQSDHDIKVCDIVLFIKRENTITNKYQYGMVYEVLLSRYDIIPKTVLKYTKNQESVDRLITDAVREFEELNLIEKLGKIASVAYMKQNLYSKD